MAEHTVKYSVEFINGEVLAQGSMLYELLEHVVINQVNHIEKKTNTISRLEKNIYTYFNQLSSIFNLAELYEEASETSWECINNVLMIYNQDKYIDKSEFITIKKEEL